MSAPAGKPGPRQFNLDRSCRRAHIKTASDGRTAADLSGFEESPGSTKTRRRVTPGQIARSSGELRESAAENEPPSPEGKGEKVR